MLKEKFVLLILVVLSLIMIAVSCGKKGDETSTGPNDSLPSDTDNGVEVRFDGDTIREGAADLDIYLKNSIELGGISLGFTIYSTNGVSWGWENPLATVVPNSRMDPDGDGIDIWTFGHLYITQQDADGVSPDAILLGGITQDAGLGTGDLEHMLTLQMIIGNGSGTLCIDSVFIPPAGNFVFVNATGSSTFAPAFAGPYCWPVRP